MIKSSAIANILNDDSFKEAMDELIKMHLDMLINSDVDEKNAREICYLRITTINEIMAHLQSIADQEENRRKKMENIGTLYQTYALRAITNLNRMVGLLKK